MWVIRSCYIAILGLKFAVYTRLALNSDLPVSTLQVLGVNVFATMLT